MPVRGRGFCRFSRLFASEGERRQGANGPAPATNALPAVVISSLIGIVVLVAVMAVTRTPVSPMARVTAAPWSAWMGGALGAIYAVTVVVVAQHLGAATLTALVITGQLVCSVVLDHFGLLGFELHAAGVGRLVGCLLLLAGTLLIWRF